MTRTRKRKTLTEYLIEYFREKDKRQGEMKKREKWTDINEDIHKRQLALQEKKRLKLRRRRGKAC